MTLINSLPADIGLLIMRVGIGICFIFLHGMQKLTGGVERWTALGKTMANLGIDFLPAFWGFMAAFAETFGALFIIIGLFHRPAAFLLAFTMLVAMITHLSKLDPWSKVVYPMELMFVFIGLFLIGPGRFSLDYVISKAKNKPKQAA